MLRLIPQLGSLEVNNNNLEPYKSPDFLSRIRHFHLRGASMNQIESMSYINHKSELTKIRSTNYKFK